ncbi:MAG TPA: aspartate aminotransferase family protein [Candidatus Tectomicrobia bacterium]|nr:aspartate aminotransferase family protein [Candidatus Tectomicrobia bacterium]
MAQVSSVDLVKEDQEHLFHPLHHPADHQAPKVWVKGERIYLWDAEGRQYIDGLACLWNVNVGHGRRELAEAAATQMAELAFCSSYTGATNIPATKLATKLASLAYPSLNTVYFTSGGAESNESAFKTARFYWKAMGQPGKIKVIARQHAYHGVTLAAMSATGMAPYWKMFEPRVPNFLHVQAPYPYRFEGVKPGETIGQAAARELEEKILAEGPDTVAAFIAEPVQGAGGVIVPPDDYFPNIRRVCNKYDVLFIADEVITGFGRTGSWFALDRWGVEPDIMSFAKGVTSGYLPLGGIMVSDKIRHAVLSASYEDRWMHAFTYSGHPTCCAVGLKNIEIIEKEGLVKHAGEMGTRLLAGLKTLYEFAAVGDVRGLGLMAAVELVGDRSTKAPTDPALKIGERVRDECIKRGVYTRTRGDVVMYAPPLVIREDEVDRIVDTLREALQTVVPEPA